MYTWGVWVEPVEPPPPDPETPVEPEPPYLGVPVMELDIEVTGKIIFCGVPHTLNFTVKPDGS